MTRRIYVCIERKSDYNDEVNFKPIIIYYVSIINAGKKHLYEVHLDSTTSQNGLGDISYYYHNKKIYQLFFHAYLKNRKVNYMGNFNKNEDIVNAIATVNKKIYSNKDFNVIRISTDNQMLFAGYIYAPYIPVL